MSKLDIGLELSEALDRDIKEFITLTQQYSVFLMVQPKTPIHPLVITQHLSDGDMRLINFRIERIRSLAWYLTGSSVTVRSGLTKEEMKRYLDLRTQIRNYRGVHIPSFLEFQGMYFRFSRSSI